MPGSDKINDLVQSSCRLLNWPPFGTLPPSQWPIGRCCWTSCSGPCFRFVLFRLCLGGSRMISFHLLGARGWRIQIQLSVAWPMETNAPTRAPGWLCLVGVPVAPFGPASGAIRSHRAAARRFRRPKVARARRNELKLEPERNRKRFSSGAEEIAERKRAPRRRIKYGARASGSAGRQPKAKSATQKQCRRAFINHAPPGRWLARGSARAAGELSPDK